MESELINQTAETNDIDMKLVETSDDEEEDDSPMVTYEVDMGQDYSMTSVDIFNSSSHGQKDIHTVYSLHEIRIDHFDVETLPRLREYTAFFLTTCTNATFGTMLGSDFFLGLHRSRCWRLYMTELMFGYLKYIASTNEAPWNDDYPPEMVDDLHADGKIIVLKRNEEVEIPLAKDTPISTTARSLSVKHLPVGLITQMFEFDIRKSDGSSSKAVHLGTTVVQDILHQASYSLTVGFPVEFKSEYSPPDSKSESGSESRLHFEFGIGMHVMRLKLYSNPSLQFELGICTTDKLVDLWYLKHLKDEFNYKTHVTPEYFEFIRSCLPQFTHCFDTDNTDGRCRFHYDCCEFGSNEDCVPGKEWAVDFDVEEVWIGWNKKSTPHIKIRKDSIKLPFIHEF